MTRSGLNFPPAMTGVLRCRTSGGLSRDGCRGKALSSSVVSTAEVIHKQTVIPVLSVCSVTVDFIHIVRVGM